MKLVDKNKLTPNKLVRVVFLYLNPSNIYLNKKFISKNKDNESLAI